MKLTDFLQDVGRPVAYYPSLRKITGSTNATILLCQFIYWRGKESDPNGWLYKTAEDIEQETGLSYGEQKTARRDLIAAGLLEEYYARLDHQMRFRLLLEAINEKWGTIETSIPESGKPQFGNDGNTHSLNESEITAENTYTANVFEEKKTDQTAAEYNVELMRGDVNDYPEHLREIAKVLRDTWQFVLPPKTKGKIGKQYGFYISSMDSLKQSCAEFGADVLVKLHADWRAGFKNGIAPYTIANPQSLVNVASGKAREMREVKSAPSPKTYDPAAEVEPEYVPAPPRKK